MTPYTPFQFHPALSGDCNLGPVAPSLARIHFNSTPLWAGIATGNVVADPYKCWDFQFHPALSGDCNGIQSASNINFCGFQSHPALSGDCNAQVLSPGTSTCIFQSHPALSGDCNRANWRSVVDQVYSFNSTPP